MYARYVHSEQHIVCFAIADQGLCAANILQNGTFAVSQTSVGLEMDGIQEDVRRARNGWNTSLAEKGTLVLLVFQ